jgi:hypothetical protein
MVHIQFSHTSRSVAFMYMTRHTLTKLDGSTIKPWQQIHGNDGDPKLQQELFSSTSCSLPRVANLILPPPPPALVGLPTRSSNFSLLFHIHQRAKTIAFHRVTIAHIISPLHHALSLRARRLDRNASGRRDGFLR